MAPESYVPPRSEPPPSLRASVRGIRAWARDNAKLITWLVGLTTAGGGATALRDQIVGVLGLQTRGQAAAELGVRDARIEALRLQLDTLTRERDWSDRARQKEADTERAARERRDDGQDMQIERLKRRTYEPEPMTVTPRP